MSRTTKHKNKALQPAAFRRRTGWWIAGVILVAVVAMAGYWVWGKYAAASGPDTKKLIGQWLRPDGGYVLELSDIRKDGTLTASYFNPKPINVSITRWKLQEGHLQVFIELRDKNYPGSTYTLSYNPKSDRLAGIYFQAALKQQFEVEFVRK